MRSLGLALSVTLLTALGQAQELSFVDVAEGVGLHYNQFGSDWMVGCAAGDYDGDGWLDVLLLSGVNGTRLYRNQRNGTFKDVTTEALPHQCPEGPMAVFCDLDNDGDQDIVMARWINVNTWDSGFLFLKNRGGCFTVPPQSLELARIHSFSGNLCISDVDQNGKLDVIRMTYFGPGFNLRPSQSLFAARGPHEVDFHDFTASFGANVNVPRRHWGGVMADFNNDGMQDLHVAVDVGPDYQARNLGGGAFTDVSFSANVTNIGQDMGVCVGDVDNDGDLDIFSANIDQHVLYINDGTGTFSNQAQARGVRQNASPTFDWGWGTQFGDLDNDGDLDLALADSGPGMIAVNEGDGYFHLAEDNADTSLKGLGLLLFDYDRDGDLDMLNTGRLNNVKLWKNVTPSAATHHWVQIDLVGRQSNRDAIGARVYLTIGGTTQMREVIGGESYHSGPPTLLHIGVGDAQALEHLELHWPSGTVQTFENLPVDVMLTFKEGKDAFQVE